MEITLEQIESVKDQTNCKYSEAKEALEKNEGSVEDAIIWLDNTNKNRSAKASNFFVESEKKKLMFILDNIVEDPSIPQEKKISLIIHTTSMICGIIAVQPIPFADVWILSPIQLIMVIYLNKAIGNPFESSKIKEIVTSLLAIVGWGVLAQQLILGAYKTVLPFIAGVTTIPLVYAATYALGKGAVVILESKKRDRTVSDEELKKAVKAAQDEAKAEKGSFSLESFKKEISDIYSDAKNFNEYKSQHQAIERKLKDIGICDLNGSAEDFLLNADVSKLFQQRYSLIKRRLDERYKNLAFSPQIYTILALLPPKTLLGEVEKAIGQMNVDINKLQISKSNKNSKLREVLTDFGIFYVIIQGKVIYLSYLEASDKLKSVMALVEYVEAMSISENSKMLHNEEIRKILEESIRSAKHEVDIISPWANYQVMNSLKKDFQSAINRGVVIKIVYGIGDFASDNESGADHRNVRTDKVMNEFYQHFKQSNRFKIQKDNTHIKLLICDNSYYVQGSFNFLSYDGSDDRNELAQYSEDKKLLEILKEAYFAFDTAGV